MSKRKVLLGLIGSNIMESLSPALFADAFVAAGIDGFYHLMDVDRLLERRLAKLLDAAKATGFAGTNITYPFKQEVIALLDAVDPEAAQIGAVNTVAIGQEGRTTGYNFDRRGWRNSFEESLGRNSAKDATVVLAGAGGAGRAVAFALMDLGVALLIIHDRDGTRANALNDDIASNYGAPRCRVSSELARDIAAAQGVVNATQMGMSGFPGNPVPVSALRASLWAADVIYTPIRCRQGGPRAQRRRDVRAPSGRSIPAFHRYQARRRTHASRVRHGACRAGQTEVRSDLTRFPDVPDMVEKGRNFRFWQEADPCRSDMPSGPAKIISECECSTRLRFRKFICSNRPPPVREGTGRQPAASRLMSVIGHSRKNTLRSFSHFDAQQPSPWLDR